MAQDLFSFGDVVGYPEIIADNLKPGSPYSSYFSPHYNWSQSANKSTGNSSVTTGANKIWLIGYSIVRACNYVIENAVKYHNQNALDADDIKAQALAIKAYVNFLLVNIFAQPYRFTADASHPGIPLITSGNWKAPLESRQTVDDVYKGVISDLNQAINLFKTANTDPLYMNKNAAKALLARVYLYKEDFMAAKNMATQVAVIVPIMQSPAYPSKLFTNAETEALFQLAPSEPGVSLPSSNGPYNGTYMTFFLGYLLNYNIYVATNDIVSILTAYPVDVRAAWINIVTGSISKFPQGVLPGFSIPPAAYYQTLLRSSEMCLTASEAYAQLNNEDSARYYLNKIRTRAGIPDVTNVVSGASLLDSIYTERRRELCFEGLRMFDLLRWKKPVNRSDYWGTAQMLPYPSSKAIAPLPQQDIETYHLQQNPGY